MSSDKAIAQSARNLSPVLILGGCGYIGSALYARLSELGIAATSVDLELRDNPSRHSNTKIDYRSLEPSFIRQFGTVILLAAHSSVAASQEDARGALANNTVGFFDLLQKLDGQRLIYASSASVYSGMCSVSASEEDRSFRPTNMYDLTKHCSDVLAEISGVEAYGLRFSTVNGPSPNIRGELMLNRMVQSAIEHGCVEVSNPDAHRPILDIRDLVQGVEAVLFGDGKPGLYNLASFNMRIGEIAERVAWLMDVPVKRLANNPTYDFTVSSSKFESEYGFRFGGTIESIVSDLRAAYSARREVLV